MDSIVKEVQAYQDTPSDKKHDAGLIIRQSQRTSPNGNNLYTEEAVTPRQQPHHSRIQDVSNLSELLQFLRGRPEQDELCSVLSKVAHAEYNDALYLKRAGSKEAQVIKQLVDSIIPDFWPVLTTPQKALLASLLRSLAGISALVASVRILVDAAAVGKKKTAADTPPAILALVQVFEAQKTHLVQDLWTSLSANDGRRDAIWRELVVLLGSGKPVSLVLQARDVYEGLKIPVNSPLATGPQYAKWLATGTANLTQISASEDEQAIRAAAMLLSKALTFGYVQDLVRSLLIGLSEVDSELCMLPTLINSLPAPSQQRFVQSLTVWLSAAFSSPAQPFELPTLDKSSVAAIAALFQLLLKPSKRACAMLMSLFSDAPTSVLFVFTMRRAMVAAMSSVSIEELFNTLTTIMKVFGDQLFITHAPVQQQEALAQTLLLSAGYLHRQRPDSITRAARSSNHMQGVSSRLASANARARWLGMIIGTGISRLVDSGVKQMNFGTPEMSTPEAKAYLDLINVDDNVGRVDELIPLIKRLESSERRNGSVTRKAAPSTMPMIDGKQMFGPLRPPTASDGPRVIEVDEDDEDDDLRPYAKPDSDPEDSDEDATLVNRNKARPPVYIRTLMAYLRSNEDAEKLQLGIKHAAALIRRKTGAGREVSDHAEELARILANLQDPFDTQDFDQLRLQALIALILSDVGVVAPWLARQAFASDYSTAQRIVLLTALGLSGRELAGVGEQDALNPALTRTEFPSKQLPPRLHAIYANNFQHRALDQASRSLEHELVQPLALQAADQSTSKLDAVKVTTFSSRMGVQRTKRKPKANSLALVYKKAFFDPLVSSFQTDVAAYQDGSVYIATSMLLATYLRTLALLTNAAGPATLELPQITSDLWTLLLFLRAKATEAQDVMISVLLSFLTLLELNAGRQSLAADYPQQIMETKEWVELVFDRTGGGNLVDEEQNEESRIRSLAAAVLVKLSEIIGAYQKRLMGQPMEAASPKSTKCTSKIKWI